MLENSNGKLKQSTQVNTAQSIWKGMYDELGKQVFQNICFAV